MQGKTLLRIAALALALAGSAAAQARLQTLFEFTGKSADAPWSNVVFDAAGNLYGTTELGGTYDSGTVFELTPTASGAWTRTVLYEFTGKDDGGRPQAGLIFDAAGNLYGTTGAGGINSCPYGCGVVFELSPAGEGLWTESVLHTFTAGADGASPIANLIFDAAGNLYGTTWEGGYRNSFCYLGCGVIFELTPSATGWTEAVLYTFMDGLDGSNSWAGLTFDTAGNLYGVAWNAGAHGAGDVFKLTPNSDGSWTQTVLYAFEGGTGGANSQSTLIFDSAGNLYGTARNSNGIVFELVPNSDGTWTEHTLHSFLGGPDGANPYAGLVFDSAGNLYGTTNAGDPDGYGIIFELSPKATGGWSYHVLYDMKDTPGAYPRAGLVLDGKGNLYGTTYGDSKKTFGSVFEITP
ncbi:MAG TPA: choice-of-anchor tandem repeat GloVer-containing protein [Candidatus Binatia bacterium]|nr:choice-of-anchor tandem repeat GloVer-containing protein [Candidatus Binatia bacterium]